MFVCERERGRECVCVRVCECVCVFHLSLVAATYIYRYLKWQYFYVPSLNPMGNVSEMSSYQMSPSISKNIIPILIILMYLFWSSSPIKIVSQEKRNLYVLVLRILKIVHPSSNGHFRMDANYIFSDTVSHTLSPLSVSPGASPFPLVSIPVSKWRCCASLDY